MSQVQRIIGEIVNEMRELWKQKDVHNPKWKELCLDFEAFTGREPLVGDLFPEMIPTNVAEELKKI